MLAHENLDGSRWDELEVGDRIYYGYRAYEVTEIKEYRALSPTKNTSLMQDLDTGVIKTPRTVINEVTCEYCLTLQTCIATADSPSWGRLFVIAEGVEYVPPTN